MKAKIGDVVIDKTYNKKGNLAIVVGEGISQPILIDHKGGIASDKLRDYFAVWDGLEVIGHIDLERIWEEVVRKADRKTENNSEKPNNCKDEPYIDIETGMLHWCGWKYKRIYEDEPQTDVYDYKGNGKWERSE